MRERVRLQTCAQLLTDSDAKARPEHGDAGVCNSEFPEFTHGRWDYSHASEIAGALVISEAKSSHGLCESRRAKASAKSGQTVAPARTRFVPTPCIYLQAALLLMPVRLSHTAGQLSGFCPRSVDGFALPHRQRLEAVH